MNKKFFSLFRKRTIGSDPESKIESFQITLSDEEINQFIDEEIKFRISDNVTNEENDPMIHEALKLALSNQILSVSHFQKKLLIGYTRAEGIMEQLEKLGIVNKVTETAHRKVLISDLSELDYILKTGKKYSEKRRYFVKSILPSKMSVIEEKVNEHNQLIVQQKIEDYNAQIKGILRNEILAKELEKRERDNRNSLKDEVMNELIEEGMISDDGLLIREPIRQNVQNRVWNRDGGKCVKCGSQENLEFDHIIPFSKGGSNTIRNLQLLCEKCNRSKSNKIG